MSRDAREEIGLWLVEHIDVVEDASTYEALEAWSRMRDQRDLARDVAVRVENENAELLILLSAAYSGHPSVEQRQAARLYFTPDCGLGVDV